MRSGANREELIQIIRRAVVGKPRRHALEEKNQKDIKKRGMYAIGG